jgi:carboxymethylenebutenolidase
MNASANAQAMLDTFQQHMTAEMTGDIQTTMATMTDDPHVNHVPVMTGGVGREGVRHFYSNHLVGKFFPPDTEITNVSRTISEDQLVEELVIKFTHTMPVDWMLVQLGLLEPAGLPVSSAESAHKVLDPKLPSRNI